jgi:hypothetical protein
MLGGKKVKRRQRTNDEAKSKRLGVSRKEVR